MPTEVIQHAWTNEPKAQVKLSKAGQVKFSHPEGVPLEISVKRTGFCCKQVVATTLADLWYTDACGTVTVPRGFHYDCASIPSWLWNFIDPIELVYESAFHDTGYRKQVLTRAYVDFQFWYLMKLRGKPWYVRTLAYYAVRLFGRKAWDKHTRRLERARKETQ